MPSVEVAISGSSPLTRGKQGPADEVCRGVGLIPTHAGKTSSSTTSGGCAPAHPHSRGENIMLPRIKQRRRGSSPLTRGKLLTLTDADASNRLIPTHAGKTSDAGPPECSAPAHPHSRGENSETCQVRALARGSSPLTRGKRPSRGRDQPEAGLIPTHAGKTGASRCGTCVYRAHPHSRGENGRSIRGEVIGRGSSPLTRGKRFLTCAFIAQIGQILESRELCASSESYSLRNVYATDAPPDQVRSIGLVPLSSRGAS